MLFGSAFINLLFFFWQSSLVATKEIPKIFDSRSMELV